jgi:hypothetical protein
MKEPVIRFSNDGSMAYAIVEKQVILKNKSEGNRIDTINYAWVSIYEKKEKDWKLVCNASTNENKEKEMMCGLPMCGCANSL